jgi:hypothetical protein
MNAKAKARYAVGFKFKRFANGKIDPTQVYGTQSSNAEFKSVENAFEHFGKKRE